jgi:hypothetical protein
MLQVIPNNSTCAAHAHVVPSNAEDSIKMSKHAPQHESCQHSQCTCLWTAHASTCVQGILSSLIHSNLDSCDRVGSAVCTW